MRTLPDGGAAPVLRTAGLGWRVGGATIVSGVTLEVREGELLSVIGPNGAGKSTLINLLSGVVRPSAGTVELHGVDVTRMRPAGRARRGLGRSFQTSSLFPGLTVLENARLAAQAAIGGSAALWRRPKPGDAATTRAAARLAEVGLADREGDLVSSLSHGDKRKLEIAVLLCGDPDVLLLDEPTAGVGAEEVAPLVDVVRTVHERGRTVVMVEHRIELVLVVRTVHERGRTVVMVEHRIELVLDVSDRIAVVHHGELLVCDTPDAVMANPVVQEAYLGRAS